MPSDCPWAVQFVELADTDWKGTVPPEVNQQDKIFGYGIGYRHMCRLFSGPPLLQLPQLQGFRCSLLLRLPSSAATHITAAFIAAYHCCCGCCLLLLRTLLLSSLMLALVLLPSVLLATLVVIAAYCQVANANGF